jgi:hypothetical protein
MLIFYVCQQCPTQRNSFSCRSCALYNIHQFVKHFTDENMKKLDFKLTYPIADIDTYTLEFAQSFTGLATAGTLSDAFPIEAVHSPASSHDTASVPTPLAATDTDQRQDHNKNNIFVCTKPPAHHRPRRQRNIVHKFHLRHLPFW